MNRFASNAERLTQFARARGLDVTIRSDDESPTEERYYILETGEPLGRSRAAAERRIRELAETLAEKSDDEIYETYVGSQSRREFANLIVSDGESVASSVERYLRGYLGDQGARISTPEFRRAARVLSSIVTDELTKQEQHA